MTASANRVWRETLGDIWDEVGKGHVAPTAFLGLLVLWTSQVQGGEKPPAEATSVLQAMVPAEPSASRVVEKFQMVPAPSPRNHLPAAWVFPTRPPALWVWDKQSLCTLSRLLTLRICEHNKRTVILYHWILEWFLMQPPITGTQVTKMFI